MMSLASKTERCDQDLRPYTWRLSLSKGRKSAYIQIAPGACALLHPLLRET